MIARAKHEIGCGARRVRTAVEGPVISATLQLRRFCRDTRGIGAIEFAFIAPILIMVYLASFELTMGFSAVKRTTSSASVIADRISQKQSVTKADLKTMVDVAESIFVPYSASGLSLKISGISIDASNNAKIAWSWASDGSRPYVAGSTATISSELLSPDSFLVHSELSVPHELIMYLPNLSLGEIRNVTIFREYYFRQRVGDGITCSDC